MVAKNLILPCFSHIVLERDVSTLFTILIWKLFALFCREHFLRCPQGLLNKHFEKLIQCDMRLNFLSRQPEISLDSPYFEPKGSICDDPVELKSNQVEISQGSSITGVQNLASPVAAHSSSFEIERGEPSGIGSENMSQEAPSPSSGTRSVLIGCHLFFEFNVLCLSFN